MPQPGASKYLVLNGADKPRRQRNLPSGSSAATSTTPLASSTARLLALLARLFAPLRASSDFTASLQTLKGLLYDKDYLRAFGTDSDEGERWREVYASRWVPARAVVYERVWDECGIVEALGWSGDKAAREKTAQEEEEAELARERETARRRREARAAGKSKDEIDALVAAFEALETERRAKEEEEKQKTEEKKDKQPEEVDVLMLGAGAGSEVLALGCALGTAAEEASEEEQDEASRRPRVKIRAVDQGAWGQLLGKMADGLREEWSALSQATAGEGGGTGEGGLEVEFLQGDMLAALSSSAVAPSSSSSTSPSSAPTPTSRDFLPLPSTRLITLCYTASELLLQSRPSFLRLLSSLSRHSSPGTLFLIVESASLALIPLKSADGTVKEYPLGVLLDHALCGAGNKDGGGKDGPWEKLRGEEGKWYRMPDGAEDAYNPVGTRGERVKLENSRVVLRLYRRR
ncbi:hypothetical protein JCM8097_001530 [Rhodosporidiobolus ruineniae]